jgi:hypothetical protein
MNKAFILSGSMLLLLLVWLGGLRYYINQREKLLAGSGVPSPSFQSPAHEPQDLSTTNEYKEDCEILQRAAGSDICKAGSLSPEQARVEVQNLGSSQQRAIQQRIKSDLQQIYFLASSEKGVVLKSDKRITPLIVDLKEYSEDPVVEQSGDQFCASAILPGGMPWCVDGTTPGTGSKQCKAQPMPTCQ